MKHGDLKNGYPYLPKADRKKILLLSDDLRMSSGVGTMSREIVLGTAHHFNWIQVGGAINHPESGKRVDLSDAINAEIGIDDTNVTIFPMSGYGSIDFLRMVFKHEKVDAIMPYTDPRFWVWLFQHEHEIRQTCPMFFYHVWDDLPFPKYNEHFYEACDWIGCISKQTYNIVKNVWRTNPPEPWQVSYVPHGINENIFYSVSMDNPGKEQTVHTGKKVKNEKGEEIPEMMKKMDYEILIETKKNIFKDFEPEFVVLYVNRNVRRKMIGDVIAAFNMFCNMLPKEQARNCALFMHTAPRDDAGTDLNAFIHDLEIPWRVIVQDARIEPRFMNILYNIADVTINLASNEGFGLGTAESLMSGTPIIVNVTGGLQDQCGFTKEDGTLVTIEDFNAEWGSNHDGRYKIHGEWVFPVYPKTRSIQGSVPTPYISDDRSRWEDAAQVLYEMYKLKMQDPDELNRRGKLGREYLLNTDVGMSASEMNRRFMEGMNTAFEKLKPRKKFELIKTGHLEPFEGVIKPSIMKLETEYEQQFAKNKAEIAEILKGKNE